LLGQIVASTANGGCGIQSATGQHHRQPTRQLLLSVEISSQRLAISNTRNVKGISLILAKIHHSRHQRVPKPTKSTTGVFKGGFLPQWVEHHMARDKIEPHGIESQHRHFLGRTLQLNVRPSAILDDEIVSELMGL
jgi:hypothetical protein